MAENPETRATGTTSTGEGQRREVTLRIDESDMKSDYANTIRTSTTMDEVILDFGVNVPNAARPNEIVFRVKQQVFVNWRTAKRMALTMSNLIRQHEERYGTIELNPSRSGESQGE